MDSASVTTTTTTVIFPQLRPLTPDKARWTTSIPAAGEPYDLQRFIVLYDDDATLSQVQDYVPVTGTFTCHYLRHHLPDWRLVTSTTNPVYGSMEFRKYIVEMQTTYASIDDSVRSEIKMLSLYTPYRESPTCGVIDLCKHAGPGVNVTKQAILAYLMINMRCDLNAAWAKMLEWMGDEDGGSRNNDHWMDISDMYTQWVIPYLRVCYDPNEVTVITEGDDLYLSLSDDDDNADDDDDDDVMSIDPVSQYTPTTTSEDSDSDYYTDL